MEVKELILITRKFPYAKTEAFLENEIAILASKFSKIYIIPTFRGGEARALPNNVVVIDDLANGFSLKLKRCLYTIFSINFYSAIFFHSKKIKGLTQIVLLFNFFSRVVAFNTFFVKRIPFLDNKVIYTYWFSESTYTLLRLRDLNNFKSKIVSRAHRYDIYEGLTDTISFWPFREYCLERIDKVYTVSEDGRNFLKDKYGYDKHIEVSKLGVFDRKMFSKRSENSELIQIVSVSRLDPVKRVELIFESVLTLAKQNKNLSFVWTHFGDGPGYAPILEQINRLGRESKENLDVRIMGRVANEEIYKFYQASEIDLFINLSSSEGIPVSIMEAQSFGIPVLATNVGGVGEIVSKDVGILLPALPSVEIICNSILQIKERNFSPSEIRAFWKKEFDAEKNFQDFVNKIKE